MLSDFAAMRKLCPLALAFVGAPSLAAAQAPPDIDHRRLIADNVTKLFNPDSHVRNVLVSELRRVSSPLGLTWGACVRVNSATGMSGQPVTPRTYVVTFQRGAVAERRTAEGNECAGASFKPLSAR